MRRALSVCTVVVAIGALATACYSTPQPSCTFVCGPNDDCPADYGCGPTDNICHLISPGGGLMACEIPDGPGTPDAPPPPPIDAPVTTPDSPVDMPDSPVGMPDSPPPPPIDAPVPPPDAAPDIDAPLPMPDAPPPPDAAVPDAGGADA